LAFQHLTSGFSTAEHPCKAELIELAESLVPHQPGQRVKEAIAALRKSGGDHTLLDAAAVASFFSTMTIVVDATGQRNVALKVVAPMMSAVVNIKRKAAWMLPIFVGVAAVAAAAYITKRRRFV